MVAAVSAPTDTMARALKTAGTKKQSGPAAEPHADRQPGRDADQELRHDRGAVAVALLVEAWAADDDVRVVQHGRAPERLGVDVDRQLVGGGELLAVERVGAGVAAQHDVLVMGGSRPRPRRRARSAGRAPATTAASAGPRCTARSGRPAATTTSSTGRATTGRHRWARASGTATAPPSRVLAAAAAASRDRKRPARRSPRSSGPHSSASSSRSVGARRRTRHDRTLSPPPRLAACPRAERHPGGAARLVGPVRPDSPPTDLVRRPSRPDRRASGSSSPAGCWPTGWPRRPTCCRRTSTSARAPGSRSTCRRTGARRTGCSRSGASAPRRSSAAGSTPGRRCGGR